MLSPCRTRPRLQLRRDRDRFRSDVQTTTTIIIIIIIILWYVPCSRYAHCAIRAADVMATPVSPFVVRAALSRVTGNLFLPISSAMRVMHFLYSVVASHRTRRHVTTACSQRFTSGGPWGWLISSKSWGPLFRVCALPLSEKWKS